MLCTYVSNQCAEYTMLLTFVTNQSGICTLQLTYVSNYWAIGPWYWYMFVLESSHVESSKILLCFWMKCQPLFLFSIELGKNRIFCWMNFPGIVFAYHRINQDSSNLCDEQPNLSIHRKLMRQFQCQPNLKSHLPSNELPDDFRHRPMLHCYKSKGRITTIDTRNLVGLPLVAPKKICLLDTHFYHIDEDSPCRSKSTATSTKTRSIWQFGGREQNTNGSKVREQFFFSGQLYCRINSKTASCYHGERMLTSSYFIFALHRNRRQCAPL